MSEVKTENRNVALKKAPSKRLKNWFYGFRKQLPLQFMVIPGVIYMIIFNYIPIYGLSIAFKNYTVVSTIKSAKWVGLENFRIILKDKFFWDSVVNTLGISTLKLAFGFVAPIIIALMIYELSDGPFKKIAQTISYLPHFLSWIILGGMMISWMSTTGMFNQILRAFGLIKDGKNMLLDPSKYWWIASLSDVWKECGWGSILYLASMAGIDPTYYEAARIDGASRLKQIGSITLPLIKPIIGLNFILTISGLLGSNLDQTMVLMNTQNQPKAEVINSYVFRMGMAQGDFSYATAAGLGVSVVSLILLLIANYVTKNMNEESVL